MSRYQPDEYDLERWHEVERQLERDEEREPYSIHPPRRPRGRRPRYFSGLLFRPVQNEAQEVADDAAA
jgi:hypothetical protein